MTDMPERIWADYSHLKNGNPQNPRWWTANQNCGTEYVRADLYEELRKRAKERILELDIAKAENRG